MAEAELDGKVVVVSGAARGQGRAIAERFVRAGARVVAGDMRVDELTEVGEALGDAVVVGELDVRRPESWEALLERGVAAFGRVDVLANNAGILRQVALERESLEAFEDLWRVNCLGAFNGIRAVVPHLRRAGGGAIVNTLSTAAITAWSLHASYASSKWALRGLTKVAALELAADGIRVNAVAPGAIATPMVLPDDDPRRREALSGAPLRRMGEPGEVAEAVLYLASDRAAFVTGAELVVDGGLLAGTVIEAAPR